MTDAGKTIAVVIATRDVARTREALRAAVGLSLRGDAIRVVLCQPPPADDAAVQRALDTLRLLGHSVASGDALGAVRDADATEVWT